MMSFSVKLKKFYDDAIVPTRGSQYAAGYDLYARIENEVQEIAAGETAKIGTGIGLEIPEGYFGALFARSGLATKQGLRPANCVGVIDSDYRGEIIVAMHNDSDDWKTINNNDRIAQLVIMPFVDVEFDITNELETTERNDSGFGSSGVSL